MKLEIFNSMLGLRKEDWHPKVSLLDRAEFMGQKKVLESWTEDFYDRDGKIIREFQKSFHSSFWEFFLHAMFKEIGIKVDMTHNAPDFIITEPCKINIEAVIANIREKGPKEETRNMSDILSMITPPFAQSDFYKVLDESIFRMSNAVIKKYKKYSKDYIQYEWVSSETPYVIAACSFDQINYGREYIYPMLALLYGYYYDAENDRFNFKETIKKPNAQKDIQLGLFLNSEYCDISAIIYSSTITIGKLTAIDISKGGDSNNIVLQLWKDYTNVETPYMLQEITPKTPELLTEGVFVFHNPNAKQPLPLEVFHKNGIVQYSFKDGTLCMDRTQVTITRLDLPKAIINLLFPYIEQQLNLYNGLDIYDIYSPKNKSIDFKNYYSIFIIIQTLEDEVFGINYEVNNTELSDKIKEDAEKQFEIICKDIDKIQYKLVEVIVAKNQKEFDSIVKKYPRILNMSDLEG